jgi:hypothetical protein
LDRPDRLHRSNGSNRLDRYGRPRRHGCQYRCDGPHRLNRLDWLDWPCRHCYEHWRHRFNWLHGSYGLHRSCWLRFKYGRHGSHRPYGLHRGYWCYGTHRPYRLHGLDGLHRPCRHGDKYRCHWADR